MTKKPNILFTWYRDTEKWTIVNDFEIHEDGELSDRHKIQTKVPRRLNLNLHNIQVVEYYEWSGRAADVDSDKEIESNKHKYIQNRYITARADIDDNITVFSIEEGALLQFDEVATIVIYPIPVGKIGGKGNTQARRGNRIVSKNGLMEGEPGELVFFDEDPSWKRNKSEEPILTLDLYLDEPQFKSLFCTLLANLEKVEKATMYMAIELFQNAMEADFNEPGMRNEYGLLKRDDEVYDRIDGHARIDEISITYSSPAPIPPPIVEVDDEDEEVEPLGAREPHILIPTDDQLAKTMRSVRTRLDWVIGLLVLLIISLIAAM